MNEPATPGGRPAAEAIAALALRLRGAEHLDPSAREEAAGLLDELAGALGGPEPPPHAEALARRAVELVEAVEARREPGLVEAARDRVEEAVEEAVAEAEARTPAADVVLRLVEVLSGIGI